MPENVIKVPAPQVKKVRYFCGKCWRDHIEGSWIFDSHTFWGLLHAATQPKNLEKFIKN